MKSNIISLIKQYKKIIIHRHERPDPDAYGSQAGLGEIIKTAFPEKKVLLAGKEDPTLNYLARLDEVKDEDYNGALVIICDTANEERVCDKRYTLGEKVIKIDHHPNREPYGDVMWVDTGASSTSEMIYELYKEGENEGLKLNDESARLLYAGIVGDTGRFLFPSTTERTFQAAKELTQYKFNLTELYNHMYDIPLKIAKFRGRLLTDLEPTDNGLAVFKIDKTLLEEYDLTESETQSIVGLPGDIEGIIAWVFFVEDEDVIRVRLRSKGPVINDVAARFNGGGHPMASGARVYSWDEADRLIADLNEVCTTYRIKG
ncbi:DHH family phosphoesterase [Bacillaceae bacterium W0354]